MLEVKGDLWDYPSKVKVITTNGSVRKDGACVMGRGVALQAKKCWPEISFLIGSFLKTYGNTPFVLKTKSDLTLVTFPVKHEWHNKADINLIYKSAVLIASIAREAGWDKIALPRPGYGNGRLSWKEVGPILQSVFDDRFVIVNNEL